MAGPIFKELADKVFAMDMDIHKPISISDTYINLPQVKKGASEKTKLIFKNLGILNIKSNEIDKIGKDLEEVDLVVKKIEESLRNGIMPDLFGMSLEDVLFYLERYDVKVQFSGYGGVVRQSITSGKKFKKGVVIKLELA